MILLKGFAVSEIEAEHTDIFCAENLCDLDGILERFKMGSKIVGYLYLAVVRADRGHAHTLAVEQLFKLLCLIDGKIGNILAVHVTQLNEAYPVLFAGGYLLTDIGRRFVGKGG